MRADDIEAVLKKHDLEANLAKSLALALAELLVGEVPTRDFLKTEINRAITGLAENIGVVQADGTLREVISGVNNSISSKIDTEIKPKTNEIDDIKTVLNNVKTKTDGLLTKRTLFGFGVMVSIIAGIVAGLVHLILAQACS